MIETGHLVVIGAGIAGISAARSARESWPFSRITVISRDPAGFYNRIALGALACGKRTEKEIRFYPPSFLADLDITEIRGAAVQRIDPTAHKLLLDDNREISWDRLIIATGVSPFVPPVPGVELPGVFPLWTLDHARAISSQISENARVTVIGGGVLGTELALDLAATGRRVKIVEAGTGLLPLNLPPACATMLAGKVARCGVDIITDTIASRITSSAGSLQLTLSTGDSHLADAIILSTGVRPDLQLVRNTGLTLSKGLSVNEYMETNIAHILAAGNGTEVNGVLSMLWNPAMAQGRIAGQNAFGRRAQYIPPVNSIHFKSASIPLFTLGSARAPQDGERVITEDRRDGYRQLHMDAGGRISSAVLLGDTRGAHAIEHAVAMNTQIPEELASAGNIDAIIASLYTASSDLPTGDIPGWVCQMCGYTHEGEEAPAICPVCAVGRDQFLAA